MGYAAIRPRFASKARLRAWLADQTIQGSASDVFKAHVRVNPFPEEDHAELFRWLAPESLLFGSDWPHPEGIPEPRRYPDYLPAGTPEAAIRRLMRDNARTLLGLGT